LSPEKRGLNFTPQSVVGVRRRFTPMSKINVHLAQPINHHSQYLGHLIPIPGYDFKDPLDIGTIPLGCGLVLRVVSYKDHVFIGPDSDNDFGWYYLRNLLNPRDPSEIVQVKVLGPGHTKIVTQEYVWGNLGWGGTFGYNRHRESITQEDCYLPGNHYQQGYQFNPKSPEKRLFVYLDVELTFQDGQVFQYEFRFRPPVIGKVTLSGVTLVVSLDTFGFKSQVTEHFQMTPQGSSPLEVLFRHLNHSEIEGGKDALWTMFLAEWHNDSQTPMDGLASVYKRKSIARNLDRLQKEAPLDWTFFRWLHDAVTTGGRKNNHLLAALLEAVGSDYDQLLAAIRGARERAPQGTGEWESYKPAMKAGLPTKRAICENLPGAVDKIQTMEAAKDFRKQTTLGGQADGLGVMAGKYPLLRAAIEGGHVPIGVFNQPPERGQAGQPINREFALWERALGQPGWAETIYEIARNASGRTTYERDITPYLMFLFRICQYLDQHAPRGRGQKWKATPKFVQSQWELEMDDSEGANENGTQKRRSAFTPVADNEKGIVEVPYVAVSVSGVRTQWCYSRHFYIFEEGFTDPESGGMVLRDLEPKLNGRDDYGLCYYTLTGTDTARGYPTFLIIFERRQGHTAPNRNGDSFPLTTIWVHFHRVRPCRSKDGVKTPACELIEACYQYMAGNIPASDITAQQGDLIFLRVNHDPIAAKAKVEPETQIAPVLTFESHALRSLNPDVALTLYRSAAKTPQNRLGYVFAPSGLKVTHPEHDHISGLTEGWYEIRRCKSWEANPKAIWSMTID